jgi:hypothetical protein
MGRTEKRAPESGDDGGGGGGGIPAGQTEFLMGRSVIHRSTESIVHDRDAGFRSPSKPAFPKGLLIDDARREMEEEQPRELAHHGVIPGESAPP